MRVPVMLLNSSQKTCDVEPTPADATLIASRLAFAAASVDVVRAAGRKTNNEAHRPGRIGLRSRDAGHRRQPGSPRCQMQECAATE
jgi:hypothetical protein